MSVVLSKIGGVFDIELDELRPLFLGTDRDGLAALCL